MKKTFVALMVLLPLAVSGCGPTYDRPGSDGDSKTTAYQREPAKADPDANVDRDYDADNTAVNVRDRGGDTLTPMDQGENEVDRKMTQEIRQALMDDDTLSFTAKNVKVITLDGKVTLRGPVKSGTEQSRIVSLATGVAGAGNVNNQLEIERT